jgi:predicted nucleic acid-binding Zn ribbon protein
VSREPRGGAPGGGTPRPEPSGRDTGEEGTERRRGLQRLGDLLPDAARQLGLENELELAAAMAAWQKIVAVRVPAAAGSCRLVALDQGLASVEADEPIVAQELRLRAGELVSALRSAVRVPVRQLRITVRHV